MFERFKAILPAAKRVTVVYQASHSGWLVERARTALRRKGLALNEIKVDDLRQAAQEFRRVLNELKENDDILWLLQDDSVVDEQAILPLVLQVAWDRNLAVVSNNPAHVRKGVLLSVYPNNQGLGISLADLALKYVNDKKAISSGINPLRDLLVSMNTRTAEHLGIYRAGRRLEGIDLTFPVER
jgi:putative ABC transport system substrate-binding protein